MTWRKLAAKAQHKMNDAVAVHRAEHIRRVRRRARGEGSATWMKLVAVAATADVLIGLLLLLR